MVSKYEIRAGKELEADGWTVDTKRGMGRWGAKNRDYFHCFDLLCKKRGYKLRWISIKGRAGVPKWHLEQVKNCWLPKGNIKEIWSRSQSKKKYWKKAIIK